MQLNVQFKEDLYRDVEKDINMYPIQKKKKSKLVKKIKSFLKPKGEKNKKKQW